MEGPVAAWKLYRWPKCGKCRCYKHMPRKAKTCGKHGGSKGDWAGQEAGEKEDKEESESGVENEKVRGGEDAKEGVETGVVRK